MPGRHRPAVEGGRAVEGRRAAKVVRVGPAGVAVPRDTTAAMDAGAIGAAWLHALGMVVVLGYYGILGRIVLPALSRSLDGEALGRAVVAIERRALPVVLLAIVLFTVTGIILLLGDERYAGLGNLFASTWTTLMTVKHMVVVLMVALGIGIDRMAAGIGQAATDDARRRDIEILVLAVDAMTALGAIVLLLTAAAQAA